MTGIWLSRLCALAMAAFALAALPHTAFGQTEERFSEASFQTWAGVARERATAFTEFQTFLTEHNVGAVVPAFQLWRTSSSSVRCNREAFAIPDRAYWRNVVRTLEYIRDHVEPAIGEIEVASGYRDTELNACSGGRPGSAHRRYFALDLWPMDAALTRETLIERMCGLHAEHGRDYAVGLGFYSRTRFHVDSMRFRRWGPDGTGATSPCNR